MLQLLIRFIESLSTTLRQRKTLLYASVYMVILWFVAALAFHFLEKASLFDSFYWVVTTTTTVGYGDIVAKTLAGKLLAIFVMLSGIGVLGVFLASFADILIEKSLKRKPKAKSYMQGHVIICGWNPKLEIAVKELLAENKQIVVVANVDSLPLEHRNLVFIRGDPSDEENLKRAGIEKASHALIACNDDTETLLAAIAVEKLNKNVHSTCIVSDAKVVRALKKIGVDQVLSSNEFFGLVLARSIFVPKISLFLKELMDVEGMDLFQEKIPELFEGKRFGELMKELKEKYDALALGVVRDAKLIVNPANDFMLEKGDNVLYVAEEKIKSFKN